MTVAELDMTPRAGRRTAALSVEVVREIVPADLAMLATEGATAAPRIAKLRDRHHQLARCLAQGMTNWEASAVTGYDPSRISILKSDPTFVELVGFYREHETALLAEFTERAAKVTLTALNNIAEMLEDDERPSTLDENLTVVKTLADRTGHAPIARSVSTNVSVELGGRLAAAKGRLAAREAITAEFTVVEEADGPDDQS
jgi:hypothetical protein